MHKKKGTVGIIVTAILLTIIVWLKKNKQK